MSSTCTPNQPANTIWSFLLLSFGLHIATVWLLGIIAIIVGNSYILALQFLGVYLLTALAAGPIFALAFSESAILLAFAITTISKRIFGRTPFWMFSLMLPICSLAYSIQWAGWLWLIDGKKVSPFSLRGLFTAAAINAPVLLGCWYFNKQHYSKHDIAAK